MRKKLQAIFMAMTAAFLFAMVSHAQPTQDLVTIQNYVPTGQCTYPNQLRIVSTYPNQTTYQCRQGQNGQLTWQPFVIGYGWSTTVTTATYTTTALDCTQLGST